MIFANEHQAKYQWKSSFFKFLRLKSEILPKLNN